MTKLWISSLALVFSLSAMADKGTDPFVSGNDANYGNDQAAGMDPAAINGKETAKSGKTSKMEAKQGLAPHTIMIQSSLKSAHEQLKGLKQELQVSSDKPSKDFVSHFKMFGREINSDLKVARVHQAELQGAAKQYPMVSDSSELKDVNSALGELSTIASNWQSKSGTNEYWNNKSQVMSDIDALEQRLSTAINRTQTFNASQLEIG